MTRTLVILALAIQTAATPGFAQSPESEPPVRPLQFDVLGEYYFSRFNFTDIQRPYDGIDGRTTLRLTWWLDSGQRLGLFGDLVPVVTSEPMFFFQRHVEAHAGVLLYPIPTRDEDASSTASTTMRLLQPVRVYLQLGARAYYDWPPDAEMTSRRNINAGLDYYYDNLGTEGAVTSFVYTEMGYHSTNFTSPGYNGFLWFGNARTGPAFDVAAGSPLIPYAMLEWTASPSHKDLWYENFLHGGAGVRWYPQVGSEDEVSGLGRDLLRRLHVYGEVLRNLSWLGDQPPPSVGRHDARVGVAFSTSGIYRDRRR